MKWQQFHTSISYVFVVVFSECLCLCWSCHVSSSLWSNVSKVTSLKERPLKVFSKCLCLCLFCQIMSSHHSDQMSQGLPLKGALYMYLSWPLVLSAFCLCLFLFCQIMSSHHSDQMSQRSQVSRIALWRYSLNVFVFVIVFVLVKFLVMSCLLITLTKCLKGHKSLGSFL